MMEVLRTSETSVYSNENTRRCFPEGSNILTRRREKMKYDFVLSLFSSVSSSHERIKTFRKDAGEVAWVAESQLFLQAVRQKSNKYNFPASNLLK
jgi:hypothetical protein